MALSKLTRNFKPIHDQNSQVIRVISHEALVAAGHGGVAQRVHEPGVACRGFVGQGPIGQLVRAELVLASLGLGVAEHAPGTLLGLYAACVQKVA